MTENMHLAVLQTAKDLLLSVPNKERGLNLRGGIDATADLGEHFKVLTAKVAEALKAIE